MNFYRAHTEVKNHFPPVGENKMIFNKARTERRAHEGLSATMRATEQGPMKGRLRQCARPGTEFIFLLWRN